jgi:acyl transferase domain-containing protein
MDDAFHYLNERGLVSDHCTRLSPDITDKCLDKSLLPGLSLSDCVKVDLPTPRHPRLFVWSAYDEESLNRTIRVNLDWLRSKKFQNGDLEEKLYLDSLVHTLSQRRSMFPWRASYVADSIRGLVQELCTPKAAVQTRTDPKMGFVFTGQGAQWFGMGQELAVFPAFIESIRDAEKFLDSIGCFWKVSGEFHIVLL